MQARGSTLCWIAGLLSLLVLGCGGGAPTTAVGSDAASAVRTFYEHLNAGRYDQAKALYLDDVRGQIFPDAAADEGFRDWAVAETHDGSLEQVTVIGETESEAGIAIEFELRFEDGETSRRRVTVSREAGAWRLGFIG